MVEMVKGGHLPLWNPYVYCGYPLLATLQVGFFYPLSLIHYLLPFHLAFNYFTILHYYLALLFMFWLMRYFQFSRGASVLSAITFAFSGYLLSMVTMNTTLTSLIWLPLILLVYDKLRKNYTFGRFVILSILFTLQFLGGEPTVFYLTSIFLLFYGLVEGMRKDALRNIFILFCALIAAAGLSAIQLLPFLEVLTHSYRVLKTDFSFITSRCFPPEEMLNLISPYFFGNLIQNTYLDILRGDRYQAWLISPCVGIVSIIFSLFSLSKINKRSVLLWLMFFFSLLLALGRYTPLFYLFYKILPGVGLVRYPVKYLSLAFFCLPILIGTGFERLVELIRSHKAAIKVVATLSLLYLVLVALWVFVKLNYNQVLVWFRSFYPVQLPAYPEKVILDLMNSNFSALSFSLVIFTVVLVAIFMFYRKAIGDKLYIMIILLIVIIDLLSANFGINSPASTSVLLNPTPNLEYLLKDKGIYRCFALDAMLPARSPDEILYNLKDNLEVNLPALSGISSLFGKESMEPPGLMYLFKNYRYALVDKNKPLADMMNVKYIFLARKMDRSDLLLLREKNVMGYKTYLYQNLSVLPRGYLVDSIKVLKDDAAIQKYLTSQAFDPKHEVVLEEQVDLGPPGKLKGKAEIVKYEPNQVQVMVSTNKKVLFFLSDSYYPGWKAYLDGKETKLLKANWFFRGVVVPTGEHKINFIYNPLSFRLGAVISFLTVLVLTLTGLIKFQKRTGLEP